MENKTFHIAMYSWFALDQITPFLHIANKLAKTSHKIFFFFLAKTLCKVEAFNIHSDLITFIPIAVPHVEGLPFGAETTNDVSFPLHPLIMTVMDLTEPYIEASLRELKPHFIFFDLTFCMRALTCKLGIKSVLYCIISFGAIGYLLSPSRKHLERDITWFDLLKPSKGFSFSSIKLLAHEARELTVVTKK